MPVCQESLLQATTASLWITNSPQFDTFSAASTYQTEEGCLSLPDTRPTERYESIEVRYRDEAFRKQRGRFSGLVAEAIQHEMDHFEGKLI